MDKDGRRMRKGWVPAYPSKFKAGWAGPPWHALQLEAVGKSRARACWTQGPEHRLGGQEILEAESIQTASLLEFLDPVFELAARKIGPADGRRVFPLRRKGGDDRLKTVALNSGKPFAFGRVPLGHRMADQDQPAFAGPPPQLDPRFGHGQAIAQFHPFPGPPSREGHE